MDPYTSSSDVGRVQCGHIFHTNCITNWIGQQQYFACPNCRVNCDSQNIWKIYTQDIENDNDFELQEANRKCIGEDKYRLKTSPLGSANLTLFSIGVGPRVSLHIQIISFQVWLELHG